MNIILEAAVYCVAAFFVGWAMYGLAMEQRRIWRINRRVAQLKDIRRGR